MADTETNGADSHIPSTTPSDPQEKQVEEISSLCMSCHSTGITRLLLTRIPFFREIVLMSFSCPECGFQNNEIQSAGSIQQHGVHITFKASSLKDLQRQIVKSDTAVFRIEDLELEIPAGRGQLTNVEGLIGMVKGDLEERQEERKGVDEGLYSKIQEIIDTLGEIVEGKRFPCTISLDDPAGNSSIEPSPEDTSGKYSRREYARSMEQNAQLGISSNAAEGTTSDTNTAASQQAPATDIRPEYHVSNMTPSLPTQNQPNVDDSEEIIEGQPYTFPTSCPGCTSSNCVTNMKMVQIPHFEQVIIMATNCSSCGYRTNEVKTGGAIPAKGRRITLHVRNKEDLSRDILKSQSCMLQCPELSLTVEPGTLGGRFTTVEGLLSQVRDDLRASIFDVEDERSILNNNNNSTNNIKGGDSMPPQEKLKWTNFFQTLEKGIKGEALFTAILQDPLGKSYVQALVEPDVKPDGTVEGRDGQIEVVEYERSKQEEDDWGLRDMKTEGYEGDPGSEKARGGVNGDDNSDEDGAGEGQKKESSTIDIDEVQKAVREKLSTLAVEEEGEDTEKKEEDG